MEFLENKTIFVTGATGFLAKLMVEKILRVQPNVKKLYLLLRSEDETTAIQRFHHQVIEKDLFRVVKEKWGANLDALISEKISVVPGDISCHDLGLKDSCDSLEEMKNQVQIIMNLAATTKFDERYDVALGTNTMGAKNIMSFSKQCCKLEVLVHVSTAYVAGEREGRILETPYEMGQSLNGTTGLDVQTEQKVVEDTLNELRKNGASPKIITLAMKGLGLKRAKKYGWPNTYVFTKAMGEMLVHHLKGSLPLIIIRPSIVTSTYKEPFPGWVEGMRTIDSIIGGYCKGKLTRFLFDINSTIDLIPADMVINVIIKAMIAHTHQSSSSHSIYHVGSSTRNPVKYRDLKQFTLQYFKEKPWTNTDGEPVKTDKVTIFNNMVTFRAYMTVRYRLFLIGLKLASIASCHSYEDTYSEWKRKFKGAMRLAELYRPYLFLKATFDDTNTERLRRATRNCNVEDGLNLDPRVISWENYFLNIHIPGLVKYVIR